MRNAPEQERRKESRFALSIRFRYQLADPQAVAVKAVTRNISSSGLLFESDTPLALDTRLAVILFVPAAKACEIPLQACVSRLERIAETRFVIGLNFVDVAEKCQHELRQRFDRMDIDRLLGKLVAGNYSDLHLTVNAPAMVRTAAGLVPLEAEPFGAEEIRTLISGLLTPSQRQLFEESRDIDFAYSPVPDQRFRINVYHQRGFPEIVVRNIRPQIQDLRTLGLPEVVDELCLLGDGLILIGGPTNAGKTTTLTAMIDQINRQRSAVIVTLEQPIEYLHDNVKSLIKQREVGIDVRSFSDGIRAALRQDPDVIAIGELRDPESVEAALQAAETGHLVIASVHGIDTLQVFERMMSFFPALQQEFICNRLAYVLRAVIVQKLLPHKEGGRRVLACEVCMANIAVKRGLVSRNFSQIETTMQTGAKFKMLLMHDAVRHLYEQGQISEEVLAQQQKGTELGSRE